MLAFLEPNRLNPFYFNMTKSKQREWVHCLQTPLAIIDMLVWKQVNSQMHASIQRVTVNLTQHLLTSTHHTIARP